MTNYDGIKLCGVEDTLGVGEMCRWPSPDISWGIKADLPGFARDAFQEAIKTALDWWAAVCGVRPRFASSGFANIQVGIQTIGPGGVLADSGLPCGMSMSGSVAQRYDTAEAWVVAENPPGNRIDLVRVACHELGHAIGIPHIGNGNLMAPVYSVSIRRPQSGDIAEAVARYGLPRPSEPTPAPVPPTPASEAFKELAAILQDRDGKLIFRINGKVLG